MDKAELRRTIANYKRNLAMMEEMLDRTEDPDASSPLVKHLLPDVPKVEPQMPLPPPPPPSQPAGPSNTLKAIESWDQIIFRPALASAMLYVIMPVVEKIITAETSTQVSEACAELDTWGKLTIAQRVAFEDLFVWISDQLYSADSVIPTQVLSNMAAASAAYDAAAS